MSKAITFTGAAFLLALSIPAALSQPSPARRDWEAFRNEYPYHIQVVAASDTYADGGRTLIIAEPPPDVTLAQLREVDPSLLANYTLWRERIGFDGWVQDAVFQLPPLNEGEFQELVTKIHIRLFGTAYKALAVKIPQSQPKNSGYQFDLHVPSSVLAKWMLGQEAHASSGGWFIPLILVLLCLWGLRVFGNARSVRHGLALSFPCVGPGVHRDPVHRTSHKEQMRCEASSGGQTRTCRDLLSSKTSGVFFSEKPGLVLWSFSRTAPLDSQKREARQFALDSDIRLGAIASSDPVAVIA